MVKTAKMVQIAIAAITLGLAIYLSTYLWKSSSPQMCPTTNIPCPQDCNKCPLL